MFWSEMSITKGEMASVIAKSFRQVQETGVIRLFKSYRPDYDDGEQKA